ncbi:MAG: type II secretion system minor pseudopilin [Rhodanobacter sp.]
MSRRPWQWPTTTARAQGGFILLTVIAMLVVLVLLASAVATISDRVRHDQQLADTRLQGELAADSTRATVLYLLGTQRVTFGGVTVDDQVNLTAFEQTEKAAGEPVISNLPVGNELRLDNTLYRGLGTSRFALQADSGLLSVNWSNPVVLQNWLGRLKVPFEQQGPLFDKLLDYQDPDDLYRLNGAEAEQYRAAGRPPPPNRPLATPLELRRVMGWGKVLAPLSDRQLLDTVTASRTAQICINTAPASVLALLPGVTPAMAERVVDMRRLQAFYQYDAVYELLPTLPRDNDLVSLHPGGSGTLAIWPADGTSGWLLHWTVTPFDDGGQPWRIDYELRLSARPRNGRTPAREATTPLLSDPPAAHP